MCAHACVCVCVCFVAAVLLWITLSFLLCLRSALAVSHSAYQHTLRKPILINCPSGLHIFLSILQSRSWKFLLFLLFGLFQRDEEKNISFSSYFETGDLKKDLNIKDNRLENRGIMFQLKVRSYGICPSPPGLFHSA